MIVPTILAVLCSILFGLFIFIKSRHNYWKKRKVPFSKPLPILGNYGEYILFKKSIGEVAQDICRQFPNEPYVGSFYGTEPALLVQDAELLKTVLTKDFYYFSSREINKYTDRELITKNMFFSGGDRWKVIRQNLTPIFTSAKMKNMFYLIEKCCHEFERTLDKEIAVSNEIEGKFLMARYTISSIVSCAFGVNTNTMEGFNEDNMFLKIAQATTGDTHMQSFRLYSRAIWPAIFYSAGMKAFPDFIYKYFHSLLVGVFKSRNYKPSNRNDFVDQVLGYVNEKHITGDSLTNLVDGGAKKVELEVNDDFLVGQCLLMFIAGFDTSATTTSFTLYELAKKQEVQKRVQAEIDSYLERHNNRVTYDCITEMPYLDACIDETLRLYPVLGVLTREVMEAYTLPSGLKLDKGLRIHIPVHHIHRNPDNFPEPEEYKPERFLGDNKKDIKPHTYLPFGEGPRICIGT